VSIWRRPILGNVCQILFSCFAMAFVCIFYITWFTNMSTWGECLRENTFHDHLVAVKLQCMPFAPYIGLRASFVVARVGKLCLVHPPTLAKEKESISACGSQRCMFIGGQALGTHRTKSTPCSMTKMVVTPKCAGCNATLSHQMKRENGPRGRNYQCKPDIDEQVNIQIFKTIALLSLTGRVHAYAGRAIKTA
jgi:hypothetical protein